MGDSVDRMYEVGLWGYAYGHHMYPFFKNGAASYLLLTLMSTAFVWRMVSAVLEGDEKVIMTTFKWMLGCVVVLGSLYNPVSFSLRDKASLSDFMLKRKVGLFGTDQGTMPWLANTVDNYLDGWVKLSMVIAKRENRFFYPGSAQAAIENVTKSGSISDPQTRSMLSQWQEVIVPAYLLQNASFAAKIKEEKLLGILMYPVTSSSDVEDAEKIIERSKRVIELLRNEPGLDLVGPVRSLSGVLNDPKNKLAGKAMAVSADETSVIAPMLSDYTTKAPQVPPKPPEEFNDNRAKAYKAGYEALESIANDPKRQPLEKYENLADLYQHLGFATDVALAKKQLQNANDVALFGITCTNYNEDYCKQSFLLAPTNMKPAEEEGFFNWDWGNRALRVGTGIGKTLGAMGEDVGLEFAKVSIPLYIGTAKGVITAATPIFMIFMLWPGRFTQGLTYILGGYVLVTLWMISYILWTYLVSDFLFGSDMIAKGLEVVGISAAMGSYPVMIDVLKMGYAALGTFSFLLVFGGMDKINRGIGGKGIMSSGTAVSKGKEAKSSAASGASSAISGAKKMGSSLKRFIP